jgi:hypothetical protein
MTKVDVETMVAKAKLLPKADKGKAGRGGKRDLSKVECFNCHENGPFSRVCPKPKKSKGDSTDKAASALAPWKKVRPLEEGCTSQWPTCPEDGRRQKVVLV